MLAAGDRIGVAVSGGADSVVLLETLRRLAGRFAVELVVLHVNHNLRGAESDDDEEFVRSLARSANLPVVVRAGPVGEGNVEGEARRLRRQFFEQCRQSHRLTKVAVGHTRTDQAETVLHRLLRGTGLTGLAAMRFVSADGLVRPLLSTSREEVRTWASAEKLPWREDSSNADLRFTRNRIRERTLPALARDYNPNLEANLASTAELAQAEEDFWTETVEQIYSRFTERTRFGLVLPVGELKGLHLAVRRRVIRLALQELRPEGLRGLEYAHIEAILRLCDSTEGHDRVLAPGADALRSFDSLLLTHPGQLSAEPRHYRIELTLGIWQDIPFGGGQICVRRVKPEALVCDKFNEDLQLGVERVQLDWEGSSARHLFVRNWEPGDEFYQPGHRTAKKVKTLFQEHHVRLWERRHWPVLVCREEIAWARDFGVSSTFCAESRNQDSIDVEFRAEGRAEEESLQ